jgi:hypothetical protein
MEFELVIDRIKEGLEYIDFNTQIINANRRDRNIIYLRGLKTLFETQITQELVNWWLISYPNDFNNTHQLTNEHTYPDIINASCDLVFSSREYNINRFEWAIELKYIQLVGDNGKNNDHTIQKVLSPYLKDRSLFHDVKRLSQSLISEKKAVIGFGFEYDNEKIDFLRNIHPNEHERHTNLQRVLNSNDPYNGIYNLEPLIKLVERNLMGEGLIQENAEVRNFNAFSHPCGGYGKVFGWEINN